MCFSSSLQVDLFQLQVNTLRRYKRHYKLQTRPGFNKAQLAEVGRQSCILKRESQHCASDGDLDSPYCCVCLSITISFIGLEAALCFLCCTVYNPSALDLGSLCFHKINCGAGRGKDLLKITRCAGSRIEPGVSGLLIRLCYLFIYLNLVLHNSL